MARPRKEAPDPVDVHLGRKLRERRKSAGLSQQALARRIGLTYQQIQKFELAKNAMNIVHLHVFAAALDAEVADFFAGMPEDAHTLRPFARAARLPAEENTTALALATAFARIPDRGVRATLTALANKLAAMEAARRAAG